MEIKRYRKLPVVNHAVQLGPDNVGDIIDWILSEGGEAICRGGSEGGSRGSSILIHTLEGDVWVRQGDWVIQDWGGFYPCKPEIFAKTYEVAD